jgi:hypothetical protein
MSDVKEEFARKSALRTAVTEAGFDSTHPLRMSAVTSIATLPSALQSATSAIRRAGDNLKKDANVVARSSAVESRDTLNALIDSRQQVLYTQAAAKLISASDEMTKSLLDIRA